MQGPFLSVGTIYTYLLRMPLVFFEKWRSPLFSQQHGPFVFRLHKKHGATFRLRIRSTHPQVRKKRPGTSTGFLWYTLFSQTCHAEAWSRFPSHPMFASLQSLHPHPSYSMTIHHFPSLSITIHHFPSQFFNHLAECCALHHEFHIQSLWDDGAPNPGLRLRVAHS